MNILLSIFFSIQDLPPWDIGLSGDQPCLGNTKGSQHHSREFITRNGWSLPTNDSYHPQRDFIELRDLHKSVYVLHKLGN